MFSPLVPIPYYHHVQLLPQADDSVSSREVRYSDKENKRFLNKQSIKDKQDHHTLDEKLEIGILFT